MRDFLTIKVDRELAKKALEDMEKDSPSFGTRLMRGALLLALRDDRGRSMVLIGNDVAEAQKLIHNWNGDNS